MKSADNKGNGFFKNGKIVLNYNQEVKNQKKKENFKCSKNYFLTSQI